MNHFRIAEMHGTLLVYPVVAALALILLVGACTSEPPTRADTPVAPTAATGPTTEGQGDAPAAEAVLPTVTNTPVVRTSTAEPAAAVIEPATPVAVDRLQIALEPVSTDLREPLFVTHAGDGSGRIFVVEKAGRIRILQNGQLLEGEFLDIRDRVESGGSELGLLGLAFPPNFAETGHFFVNYTGKDVQTHISRFSVVGGEANTADADSEFTVLAFQQPAGNHNGGMLAFGPDGYLYVGTGDGGAAFDRFGNGQNPATLLGKMLRIDVTTDPTVPYLIPTDNPWVHRDLDGADVLDEVWAIGLRNPWRYSFDRATGDLWIADVGQNQYEEINWTEAGSSGGLNFGWPIQEATHCLRPLCSRSGLVQPILEYSHAGGHCSVTGGYVYRGSQYPAMTGVYLYGDYCSGAVWAAAPDGQGGWRSALIHQTDANISSFGEDEAGEMYMADLAGVVYRVGLAD